MTRADLPKKKTKENTEIQKLKKYRNPKKLQKSRNPQIQYFENLKSPKKSSSFDTSGSPVALFVPKIWPEIPKKIQKSRNPEILFFFKSEKPLEI